MSAAAGIEPGEPIPAELLSTALSTYHVAIVGDLSGARALRLETQLIDAAMTADRLVVNLSRATHLSLVALRSLVRARGLIDARRAEFIVQGQSRAVGEAFARIGVRWGSNRQ